MAGILYGKRESVQGAPWLSMAASTSSEKPMPGCEIILYWSQPGEAFIAEVPELPSCAADGKTYKEALANAEIIIQEWIETAKEPGRPIPAHPRLLRRDSCPYSGSSSKSPCQHGWTPQPYRRRLVKASTTQNSTRI